MSVNREGKETNNYNQNEILSFKKKMRYNESEYNKERAIMKQKIDLLQTQAMELVEREASQRKMHEAMISALKDQSEDPQKTQDYFEKQLAKSELINQESLKILEEQYQNK